jgi:hypothetical protein
MLAAAVSDSVLPDARLEVALRAASVLASKLTGALATDN